MITVLVLALMANAAEDLLEPSLRAGEPAHVALTAVSGPADEITFAESESFVPEAQAGEPIAGFPKWDERVIHQWMNRARSDPQAELKNCPGCADAPCYSPMPPLGWSEALNRSARFHADEMRKQGYFGHDSKCVLVANIKLVYPESCDGSASCACKEAGSTSWPARIALFGALARGEIIASVSDPQAVFYLWLYEGTATSTCQFSGSNGHRWLILKSGGAVGIGVSGRSVGDFGGGTTPLKIVSGAHHPRQADTVEVWANWYDFAPPRSASVVVDGKCVPMVLRRGSPQNGAYMATLTGVGSGCHRYYFIFTDAGGTMWTYPTNGSFGIGGTTCADWDGSRTNATCLGSNPSRRRRLTRRD